MKEYFHLCEIIFVSDPGGKILKFHEEMLGPFAEKEQLIEKNFENLEKEQRTEKSVSEIKNIYEKYSRVREFCINKITFATGHEFSHPDLFLFVFLYREITQVFNYAQTNPVKPGNPEILSTDDLKNMLSIKEERRTLAHIGDAALELGVLASIWPPDTATIPSKEFLHNERNKLVGNIPLSEFWDSLQLYDSKTLIQYPDENVETKGSCMEAVFGIIYLEGGLDSVEMSLKNLKNYYDEQKTHSPPQ